MPKLLITCGLIALTWLAPTVVSAQNRNTTGSGNSGFGNTGSSGFGGTGSSGFGNTGTSGFGGTGGGFGTNGGTGGLGGQNGFGTNGQTGFGGQNSFGANGNNNGGILGRNTNQNQFLGRNVQNQGMGGNTNFGGGNRGGGNRRTGANALNNAGGAGGANANQTPLVRPRQKVAFDWPQPKPEAIQVALETRLTKLSLKSPGMKNVTLSIEDKGEVVLRGVVDSEAEAKKAELSLRLEPGVWKIRNELTFPRSEAPDE